MARDPLRILLAIRHRSVEQARSALGACLKAEATVADGIRSLEDAARRDRVPWQDAHQFHEMAAARLQVVRAERLTAAAALEATASRSEAARGVVAEARTAAEAVEQLIGEREAANRAGIAAREQHTLDDIARARLAVRRRSEGC
jgi:flagellar biosynthesis chaperone FliJ